MSTQNQRKLMTVGVNVVSYHEGTMLWFGVDTSVEGTQTEGSKGLDKKGHQKTANEMVGSTRSYTAVGDGKLLLHYIRPMSPTATRKAKALNELDEEAVLEQAKAVLARAGVQIA